jgi:carbon-monoxide dehydrogenase medium subunit
METKIANVRVRATGTLGGNLCFAEPHSDPANLLLCLGATVTIQGGKGERTVPMDELIVDAYETSIAMDEVLTSIEIPLPDKSQRTAYLKFQIHERPTLGLALLLNLGEGGKNITKARVVVGCISLKPCRSEKAEALLVGPRDKVEKQLPQAAQILADLADPSDDLEGSAEYKRHLVGVFLRRAFAKALASPPPR